MKRKHWIAMIAVAGTVSAFWIPWVSHMVSRAVYCLYVAGEAGGVW